jgi:hypothetical protein
MIKIINLPVPHFPDFFPCLTRYAGATLLLFSTLAFAAPEVLNRAQQQLAAGNPKQAYMLLIAEQDKLGGDVEFDYLLGVAALQESKKCRCAA